MRRHLVDPELVAGIDRYLTQSLSKESLSQYRSMLEQMVAAAPKPESETVPNVRLEERRIPGPTGAPDVHVLVYTPDDHTCDVLPAILHIYGVAIDPFLEESLDYAQRLALAGVVVELHVWPGAYHALGSYDDPASREVRLVARTAIKRVLHGESN